MNNTVVRTLSGIVFIGIMVGAILLSRYTFIALTTVIIVLGMLEFYRLTMPNVGCCQKMLGVLCGVVLNFALFVMVFQPLNFYPLLISLLFLALFMATFISSLYVKLEKPFEVLAYIVTAILYVALPFALMNTWVSFEVSLGSDIFVDGVGYSGLSLLAFFIILWTNDVGAYCFGITIGRIGNHKLFPRHSPKKTWEGFIGGVLVAMLAAYLLSIWMFNGQQKIYWVGLGLIIAVFATFGDLVESMLKRSVGVKDSGNIMPGHGGILDRFDGVLLSFIPASVYVSIFDISL